MMYGMDGFKINEKSTLTILAPYDGEYKFFFMNASQCLQNYDKITVEVNPRESEMEKRSKDIKRQIEKYQEQAESMQNQIAETQWRMNENITNEEMQVLKEDYDILNEIYLCRITEKSPQDNNSAEIFYAILKLISIVKIFSLSEAVISPPILTVKS